MEKHKAYHKSKSMEEVIQLDGPAPEWFQRGVEVALLAPTAMNQQKFCFAWIRIGHLLRQDLILY